ncbi:polyprenyl synthetase family protein [Nesterenkonia sp.]|uniref:polyprenyl synthetase family protein n=1 Tax=Nesterenkonia sp. TaxID=704201 RepID=UPI002611EEF1|nr:polyprenyl synthetase family protein [Nesterenkonia sp.]
MIGQDFVRRVNDRCEDFLTQRRAEVREVSEEAAPLADALLSLTAGGKKLRPLLGWIGWRSSSSSRGAGEDAAELLGVALELFQAAALIHDDVIDRSATRRGQPSTHRRFEQLHARQHLGGDAAHFGTTGAILSGDLALAWASEAFSEALTAAERAGTTPDSQARGLFGRMHTEVITGQYLDVLAEVSRPAESEEEAVRRARNVLRYKAAKYSSEYPVLLGCALAGGGTQLSQQLAAAALPLGEAFQLRDDLLGVFGDPAQTGKPVGDDLREGKRTELIAYGLFRAPADQSQQLASLLGRADLTEQQVAAARRILTDSGAVRAVEESIAQLRESGMAQIRQLSAAGVDPDVISDFHEIAERLVSRTT